MENKNKEEDLNEGMEFKEEIIIEQAPFKMRGGRQKKLNQNKVVGKKKVLGKVGLRAAHPEPKPEITQNKQTNAQFLIDSILKTYWTSKWKEQLTIMKFSRIGYNKKRADFRNFCMKLNHSMKYHQYLFLIKLFDNMEKLPVKPEVKHDDFYGKIKLVCNSNNRGIIQNEIKESKENNNVIIDDNVKVEIKIDVPQ